MRKENTIPGLKNRFAQYVARFIPGATSTRVWLHRIRGVKIGNDVFIGTDVLMETAHPERISIGDHVIIGIRSILVAHFDAHEIDRGNENSTFITIEDDVFLGPGVIVLPNVRIGRGAVVTAGSVVTHSVPARTMVQGNPARPVARCNTPLRRNTPIWQFYRDLKKIEKEPK
jgi:acetyltransferase-like isoleucine patch superfamily enzyme